MNRLLHSDGGKPRGRKPGKRNYREELEDDFDEMSELFGDIDTIVSRHAGRSAGNLEVRRRIEMLREEQWLQQELSDCYDA